MLPRPPFPLVVARHGPICAALGLGFLRHGALHPTGPAMMRTRLFSHPSAPYIINSHVIYLSLSRHTKIKTQRGPLSRAGSRRMPEVEGVARTGSPGHTDAPRLRANAVTPCCLRRRCSCGAPSRCLWRCPRRSRLEDGAGCSNGHPAMVRRTRPSGRRSSPDCPSWCYYIGVTARHAII